LTSPHASHKWPVERNALIYAGKGVQEVQELGSEMENAVEMVEMEVGCHQSWCLDKKSVEQDGQGWRK
jgi:hypothetical protein